MRECDVLVVGAGPAGMAAACSAAECGARVAMADDNPSPGGQIWRAETAGPWFQRLRGAKIELIPSARMYAREESGALFEQNGSQVEVQCAKIILATGARERFLPFPGWTLPGVFGAGGLQALVKSGLPVEGKRIVVAGSGPLLLVVAAFLKQHGARVRMIAEQAPATKVRAFAKSLWREPSKLLQGARLRANLFGVPYRFDRWPVRADGSGKLERVILNRGAFDCDYLACGFGLVPNTELAALLGCRIDDGFVAVNHWQETTAGNVYCAGEPTGIGGVEKSLLEGQIAGFSAAGNRERARLLFPLRDKASKFRRLLDLTFAPRAELTAIATPDTIVCRCEDVTLKRILDHHSWRELKMHTRCGMGPCQGRICGPAIEVLRGWPADSVRPPLYPVPLKLLAGPPSTEL